MRQRSEQVEERAHLLLIAQINHLQRPDVLIAERGRFGLKDLNVVNGLARWLRTSFTGLGVMILSVVSVV